MLLPDCASEKLPGAANPLVSRVNALGSKPVTLVAVAMVHW
jgi:hypothetical protein